ncbi:WxL domain-containing protein [Enterococcus sp. AZ126]|uniref:WxL domain-containing protein n=1 Tax=Enterococcus sp. AZ126 TaxID=2774635 RepID=UPI003F26E882
MKKKTCIKAAFLLALLFATAQAKTFYAKESSLPGDATIDLKGYKEENPIIRDPENPEVEVDPGETPQTDGELRIDFVPKLNFSTVMISKENTVFPVNAQLFHGNTSARGNFVQVSDYRDDPTGWTLQVRQENQFKHATKAGAQLKGAVISFDQTWANSTRDLAKAPMVSKDVIRMSNVGETYNLAEAQLGKGTGTWSIVFGASEENHNERPNTLQIRKDGSGKEMTDPIFKKPVYTNRAVTLFVPGATEKEAGAYSTVLTWVLAELP